MVDTVDSKSAARKGVRVQVPPGVQNGGRKAAVTFTSCAYPPSFTFKQGGG